MCPCDLPEIHWSMIVELIRQPDNWPWITIGVMFGMYLVFLMLRCHEQQPKKRKEVGMADLTRMLIEKNEKLERELKERGHTRWGV